MYLVVGAGLAGLSAAHTLQESGARVTVVESTDRVGGRVASDVIDGFILDRGFQLINLNYPEIKRRIIASDLNFKIAPRRIGVATNGGLVYLGDPREGVKSVFSPKTGNIISKASFLRYLLTRPKSSESVKDHMLRTGTRDLYEKVLKPFLQGVFLADPSLVSAVTGREIIGTFLNGKSGIPATGVSDFAEKLAQGIKDIKFNTQVEEILDDGVLTNHGKISAQKIILATDLTTAGQLMNSQEIVGLTGSTTWYHSTDVAPSSGAELIIDSLNRGPVINSIVISNLSGKYAPQGQHLISSTTLGHASESEVRRHLAQMWGSSNENWRFLAKYEIHSALPLFTPGQKRSEFRATNKNLYCAGDYLESPSQNGALLSGRKAAESLLFDQRG